MVQWQNYDVSVPASSPPAPWTKYNIQGWLQMCNLPHYADMGNAQGWGAGLPSGPSMFKEASLKFEWEDFLSPHWSFMVMGTQHASDPVGGVTPMWDFNSRKCYIWVPAEEGTSDSPLMVEASPQEWNQYKSYRVREVLPELGTNFVQRPTLLDVSKLSIEDYVRKHYFPLRLVSPSERDINYSLPQRQVAEMATAPSFFFWEGYNLQPLYYDANFHTVSRTSQVADDVLMHTGATDLYVTSLFVTDGLYVARLAQQGLYMSSCAAWMLHSLAMRASRELILLLQHPPAQRLVVGEALARVAGYPNRLHEFVSRVHGPPHHNFATFPGSYHGEHLNQWRVYLQGDCRHPLYSQEAWEDREGSYWETYQNGTHQRWRTFHGQYQPKDLFPAPGESLQSRLPPQELQIGQAHRRDLFDVEPTLTEVTEVVIGDPHSCEWEVPQGKVWDEDPTNELHPTYKAQDLSKLSQESLHLVFQTPPGIQRVRLVLQVLQDLQNPQSPAATLKRQGSREQETPRKLQRTTPAKPRAQPTPPSTSAPQAQLPQDPTLEGKAHVGTQTSVTVKGTALQDTPQVLRAILAADPLFGIGERIKGIPHPSDFTTGLPAAPDFLSNVDRKDLYKAMLKERAARRTLERQFAELQMQKGTPRATAPSGLPESSHAQRSRPVQANPQVLAVFRDASPRPLPGFVPPVCPTLADSQEATTREGLQELLNASWAQLSEEFLNREQQWIEQERRWTEHTNLLYGTLMYSDQDVATLQQKVADHQQREQARALLTSLNIPLPSQDQPPTRPTTAECGVQTEREEASTETESPPHAQEPAAPDVQPDQVVDLTQEPAAPPPADVVASQAPVVVPPPEALEEPHSQPEPSAGSPSPPGSSSPHRDGSEPGPSHRGTPSEPLLFSHVEDAAAIFRHFQEVSAQEPQITPEFARSTHPLLVQLLQAK